MIGQLLKSSNYASVTPHHHKLCIYGTNGTFGTTSHLVPPITGSRDPIENLEEVSSPYPELKGDLLANFIDS